MRAEPLLLAACLTLACRTTPTNWDDLDETCREGRWTDELEFYVWSPDECIEEEGHQLFEVDVCTWYIEFSGDYTVLTTPSLWADTRTGYCLSLDHEGWPGRDQPDDPFIRRCWEVDVRCCDPVRISPCLDDEEAGSR